MNSKRFWLLAVLVVLAAALLLVTGCSRHYVEVYINEECLPATADMDNIKTLWVFPGDYVVFINAREVPEVPEGQTPPGRWVKLTFPDGMFEENEVRIDPGKRVILKVIADGPMEGLIAVTGPTCPLGSPEVKVGEGP